MSIGGTFHKWTRDTGLIWVESVSLFGSLDRIRLRGVAESTPHFKRLICGGKNDPVTRPQNICCELLFLFVWKKEKRCGVSFFFF